MIRPLLTALISLSVTFYFIAISLSGLGQEYIEDGWITARGTVLSQDRALDGAKNIQRKNRGIEQVINYEYTVGNKLYRSNSVSPEIYVDPHHYPEGKTIDVYYNPKDHSQSVLVRSPAPKHYLYGLIVTCIFIIFVILYCCVRDIKAMKGTVPKRDRGIPKKET